jgi:hypothetical protein
VSLSGRGDKDVETAAKWFGLLSPGDDAGHEAARGRGGQSGSPRQSNQGK